MICNGGSMNTGTGRRRDFRSNMDADHLCGTRRFDDIQDARARELQMKKWKRSWKLQAIEEMNPDWRDLFEDIVH